VRLLLQYHANPNVKWDNDNNDNGQVSALSYAEEFASNDPKLRQIAQMLKDAGAKE